MNPIKLLTCICRIKSPKWIDCRTFIYTNVHDRKPLYSFLTMHDILADIHIPASFSYKEIKVSFKCSNNDKSFLIMIKIIKAS